MITNPEIVSVGSRSLVKSNVMVKSILYGTSHDTGIESTGVAIMFGIANEVDGGLGGVHVNPPHKASPKSADENVCGCPGI